MKSQLLAGTGRADITPAPGTPQGGWGAQIHTRGVAADMPFYATALALVEDDSPVIIIDADAIGFDQEWTGNIVSEISRQTGVPADRIRFSCTHTHSGPNTFRLANIAEGADMALSYLASLPDRIAGAAWQAFNSLRPVRVAAGSGTCGINVNRRVRVPDGRVVVGLNPEAPADQSLRVVRCDDLDGSPVATLVHYACHGTTIAWQSRHFTPDFPGPARMVVERELGGRCLFLQGASGDLGPREGFTGDLAVYRRLGTELGLTAAAIAAPLQTLPKRARFTRVMPSGANIALYEYEALDPEPPRLAVISRSISLPLKHFDEPGVMAAEIEQLRAEAARHKQAGDEEAFRLASALATQAGWRAGNSRLYYGRSHTDWPVQAVRIGSIALLSVVGEPFSGLGSRIAGGSPFLHTLFSGYSNGGFGYIPDRSAYGEGGYEIEATPFSQEAGDLLVSQGIAILNELFHKDTA
ncbi:MAG TPA: neutral/alkaline non-lysosomal ceramidase N-terminal domain-containing protein [Bryobacteraceae bacterium]|nr:neutral/alkaline non-lysosomal ceramidase N-terminal domain-containing protein [Bryobacteraceae bacterium]